MKNVIKKNINKITSFIFINLFLVTQSVFAQNDVVPTKVINATTNLKNKTIGQLVTDFIMVLSQYVLKLLLALIIFVFLYGLMKYMFKGQGSDTARAEGRKLMLWGIVGIFVITSLWGIVTIFASFVGHSNIVIPQFK